MGNRLLHVLRRGTVLLSCLLAIVLLGGCGNKAEDDPVALADTLLAEGDYEGAFAAYRALLDEGSSLARSWRGIGIIQLAEGSYADACISFEKSLLNMEKKDEHLFRDTKLYLASARVKHGEREKALAIYEELLEESADPDILFLRGSVYLADGDEEKAAADFTAIAEGDPASNLLIRIYEVYRDAGRKMEGTAYLEKIIEGGTPEDHPLSKGFAYYYMEDYENAKNSLAMAVKDSPEDMDAMMLLGRSYLALGEVNNARAVFTARIDKAAGTVAAYNGLALCDMAEGDYESALENIAKGIAGSDETAAAGLYYNEIVILEYLGRWGEAREKAAAYVKRYPTDEDGAAEYAFLSTR